MPMNGYALKTKLKQTIYEGLKAEFSESASKGDNYLAEADKQWQKMAEALSGIAVDIISEIQTNASVLPGIPVATAGSPAAQTGVTTSPGSIL